MQKVESKEETIENHVFIKADTRENGAKELQINKKAINKFIVTSLDKSLIHVDGLNSIIKKRRLTGQRD